MVVDWIFVILPIYLLWVGSMQSSTDNCLTNDRDIYMETRTKIAVNCILGLGVL
jgi:hypothetical protein